MQMQRGILGGLPQRKPKGILGGLDPIRQFSMPQGDPSMMGAPMGMGGGMPMMGGMGGAPEGGPAEYGSDEWALQGGGPGGMIWRELAKAGVWQAIDPKNAGEVFSDQSRAILGGDYAKKAKRKG